MTNSFDQDLVVLGIKRLQNGHAAEELKIAIEEIVNSYQFDKKKIRVC
jgi:hypothetical protein